MSKLLDQARQDLIKKTMLILGGADYSAMTPEMKQTVADRVGDRIGRMKWVDEHVIATDLVVLRHQEPELFGD